ncbi:hypothetical protein GCM10011409_32130 [Lentibacillus populi]|uniref:Uncharacterized protein n=1 Tax=Lentibacillus populi TaxID=1827502 RepID=A0A9W5U052_9BACI|nr:hypothetical protein GCM10011409_32130 [Lentibacillus populi]
MDIHAVSVVMVNRLSQMSSQGCEYRPERKHQHSNTPSFYEKAASIQAHVIDVMEFK